MTSKDLAEQIRNNTRVILPNFGAFLQKSNEKGDFNANNITFSPFLRYNDGVLENHIAQIKGISIDQAAKEVLALTDEIARSIASTKNYEIEGLGFLIQDQNRNIQFISGTHEIQNHNTNNNDIKLEVTAESTKSTKVEEKSSLSSDVIEFQYDTKSTENNITQEVDDDKTDHTLNNHQESPVDEETQVDKSKPIPPHNESFNAISPKTSTSAHPFNNKTETKKIEPVSNSPKKQQEVITFASSKSDSNHTEINKVGLASIPLKKRLLIILLFIVASIAIIMGIAYLIRRTVFPTQIRIEKPQPIVVESDNNSEANSSSYTITNTPKDSIDTAFDAMKTEGSKPQDKKSTNNIENEIQKSVINNAKQKNATTAPPTVKTTTTPNFYLVVGSFQDRNNAQKLHDELKQKNLDAIVVKRPNGTFAVSIGSYATRNEAESAKTKHSSSFPAAWIMSKPQ